MAKPMIVSCAFSVRKPAPAYTARIVNGPGGAAKVTSAEVRLNGELLAGPEAFKPTVDVIETAVTPLVSNRLEVQLRGAPDGALEIEVYGIDKTPPTIRAMVDPPPNAAGWNNTAVTVSFACEDDMSGVARCPAPVALSSDTGGVTVTGTAADVARNTATASVTVRIDKTPPTIAATQAPPPNAAGWNNGDVTVSFACSDALSGVATCTPQALRTSETAGETVSGTAVDVAGNVATAARTVRIDRTPPAFSRTWPPASPFTTDQPHIDVVGHATDALSGAVAVEVQGPSGAPATAGADFAIPVAIPTDVPAGARWRESTIVSTAMDAAGNRVEERITIRYTQESFAAATDPARAETSRGVLTSVDRALVAFSSGTTRSQVEASATQLGGRVAGWLGNAHVAIIRFNTASVTALEAKLDEVRAAPGVAWAAPVSFARESAGFDNDLLPASGRAAYDAIHSSAGAGRLEASGVPLSPVGIVLVDSGVDTRFGVDGELSGIGFVDQCDPANEIPTDLTGHGTRIAGIVAGANNYQGNNGLVAGLTKGNFTTTAVRTVCDQNAGVDLALVFLTLDQVLSGRIGPAAIVNMGFATTVDTASARRELATAYEYFLGSTSGRGILWVAPTGGAFSTPTPVACDGTLAFPAGAACDLNNVVAVGGYRTTSDTAVYQVGPAVTIYAPATDVMTATSIGGYGRFDGTSAAAALVTGAAALVSASNPVAPDVLRRELADTARPLTDPALPQGGLDVAALVDANGFPQLRRQCWSGGAGGGRGLTSPISFHPASRASGTTSRNTTTI